MPLIIFATIQTYHKAYLGKYSSTDTKLVVRSDMLIEKENEPHKSHLWLLLFSQRFSVKSSFVAGADEGPLTNVIYFQLTTLAPLDSMFYIPKGFEPSLYLSNSSDMTVAKSNCSFFLLLFPRITSPDLPRFKSNFEPMIRSASIHMTCWLEDLVMTTSPPTCQPNTTHSVRTRDPRVREAKDNACLIVTRSIV